MSAPRTWHLEDARQTILRREARRRRYDEAIEQAKNAAREASVVAERAYQALIHSAASAAAGATAVPSSSTRPQSVASQRTRPGDDAFLMGGIVCMASEPRAEFSGWGYLHGDPMCMCYRRDSLFGPDPGGTLAIAGTATVGVVAPGVAAKKVEAEEARRALVVAQDAAKGATRVTKTEAVAAALGEAPEGGGTAQEAVQRGTARPPPPAS